MSAALTLEGVHTHIGRYHILQGVDFDAPAGQTTMLLGRNGAGKTTALAHHHGPVARLEGTHRARRDAARRASPRATSRGSASAMRRRRWRSSPTSR